MEARGSMEGLRNESTAWKLRDRVASENWEKLAKISQNGASQVMQGPSFYPKGMENP
jgi:hypothetical protein